MKPFFVLLVTLFALQTIVNGQPITMTAESNSQGKFKSETQNDKIVLTGATLEVTSPTSGTGMSTGRRQHQPFVIKKPVGASSAQFMQALITNDVLRKVVIEFRGTNEYGEEAVVYKITLDNARVSNFKQTAEIPENTKAPKNVLIDEIRLTYQKITVESMSSQIMATDDTGQNAR